MGLVEEGGGGQKGGQVVNKNRGKRRNGQRGHNLKIEKGDGGR